MPETNTKKKKHSALGAGLDALIPPARAGASAASTKKESDASGRDDDGRVMMAINKVEPDPDQPRKNLESSSLCSFRKRRIFILSLQASAGGGLQRRRGSRKCPSSSATIRRRKSLKSS